MLATRSPQLFVGVCLAACIVAADDDGDDFSNNLFSDLAPYVSLLLFDRGGGISTEAC